MVAGRYTLEREIGRGGMGAVWLAHDEVLGRHVAIKRIGMMPGSTDADLERAEREGRLAAMLNHPNVVAVFDLVEDNDGDEHWLVMEYVDSLNLATLVREQGPLSPDAAAPLVLQAAEALDAAHAAGIVHRDVKPSNFLVTPGGQAKLTDFGIARAHADPSLTRTGLVTGSPAYLAPEVAAGSSATTHSDVWGLGATLFHMLSGRPPYEVGDNLMGAMYRIVHEEPPRLDNAGWLSPLLDATMTRDPGARWSMADVKAFIASHGATVPMPPLGGAPADPDATVTMAAAGAAPPPTGGTRVVRRRRALLPAVLASLLVVVLFAVLGWWWLDRDRVGEAPAATPPTQTQEPEEPQETEEPTAEGMEQFVADYLATVVRNPKKSFEMLTPSFQEKSNGLAGYRGFWRTVRSAELRAIEADPDAMTVEYTVDYELRDRSTTTDDVRLRLVLEDGQYLIADEA